LVIERRYSTGRPLQSVPFIPATASILATPTSTHFRPPVLHGSGSLIVWTLIIVTTIKYVGVAMRIDNNGEGVDGCSASDKSTVRRLSLLGFLARH
jgi:hypothetical protein